MKKNTFPFIKEPSAILTFQALRERMTQKINPRYPRKSRCLSKTNRHVIDNLKSAQKQKPAHGTENRENFGSVSTKKIPEGPIKPQDLHKTTNQTKLKYLKYLKR